MLTKQSLFSRTWQHHILDENPLGLNANPKSHEGMCHYGHPTFRTQCGLGCNILIDEAIEWNKIDNSAISLCIEGREELSELPLVKAFLDDLANNTEVKYFAVEIQRCHDSSNDIKTYKEKLTKLASDFKLELVGDK